MTMKTILLAILMIISVVSASKARDLTTTELTAIDELLVDASHNEVLEKAPEQSLELSDNSKSKKQENIAVTLNAPHEKETDAKTIFRRLGRFRESKRSPVHMSDRQMMVFDRRIDSLFREFKTAGESDE